MSPTSPSSLASLDGEIAPAAETSIPVTDEGFVRGDGVFEVIRVYDGKPFRFEDHMARMERSARGLRLPIDLESVRAECHRLLARAGAGSDYAALRVIVTRGGRRLMLTEPMKEFPEVLRVSSVTYAPTRVLDGVKSLSYAANMLAHRLAEERGFDEALLVTPRGRVLEGPTCSLFVVKDGVLTTPPLDDHILASITRAIVIELTGATERACTMDDVAAADELFFASTIREVHPIVAVDELRFDGPGPVSREVAAAFAARVQAELGE